MMAFTGGMRILNLFQMQLNETALFARHLRCHSVNKPHNLGATALPLLTRQFTGWRRGKPYTDIAQCNNCVGDSNELSDFPAESAISRRTHKGPRLRATRPLVDHFDDSASITLTRPLAIRTAYYRCADNTRRKTNKVCSLAGQSPQETPHGRATLLADSALDRQKLRTH